MPREDETLEEAIERLSPSLRGCLRHNNPARIETDLQGDYIISPECGCYMETAEFDSLDDAVSWWNERPYQDRLEELVQEVERVLNDAYANACTIKYLLHNGRALDSWERNTSLVKADNVQKYAEARMVFDKKEEKWKRKEENDASQPTSRK